MTDNETPQGIWYRLKTKLCPYIVGCGPYARDDEAWAEWHEERSRESTE